MATVKSVQRTNKTATPIVKLNPTDGGISRVAFFEYTTPTGNLATSDIVELADIPANSRILGGFAAWEAMSSGAGDASIQIGIVGTAAKYLGTTSVDAAGKATFADTIALKFGEVVTAETTLIATVITEAWVAAKKLYGYVEYVTAD